MEINKDNLEKALNDNSKEEKPTMSKEMEIGFHQGSLNTLAAERNELFKMIQNVEGIMKAHINILEELGVKIQTQKPE